MNCPRCNSDKVIRKFGWDINVFNGIHATCKTILTTCQQCGWDGRNDELIKIVQEAYGAGLERKH